jgi:hypothetical protein
VNGECVMAYRRPHFVRAHANWSTSEGQPIRRGQQNRRVRSGRVGEIAQPSLFK